MSTIEATDQLLWEGIRQGNETCFAHVFNRYHAAMYNYGCKSCGDSSQVEDAVQEVFIDVWRLRANLTPTIGSLKFYLYRSLQRRIRINQGRGTAMQDLLALPVHETPSIIDNSETLLIEYETKSHLTSHIDGMLAKLPQRQVEAITLRYFDEFSFAETAQIMGVSEKSVRNFIYRAFVSLREDVQPALLSAVNIGAVFVSSLLVNFVDELTTLCEVSPLY